MALIVSHPPKFVDKSVACVACGQLFQITAGECYFYWEHDWPEVKRCLECRRLKRSLMGRGGGNGK